MSEWRLVLTVIAWVLGSLVCFGMVNKRSDESALVNLGGSLIWWPVMVLIFMASVAFKAGQSYAAEITERRRLRALPLRAGAENGLYE